MKLEFQGENINFMEKVLEKSWKQMGCKDKNLLISEEIVKKTRVDKAHFWSHNFSNSKFLYYLGSFIENIKTKCHCSR